MSYDFEIVSEKLNLPDGYKPLYEESPRYYQLSGLGMGAVLEAMNNAGLLKMSSIAHKLNTFLMHLIEYFELEDTIFARYAGAGKPWFSKKIYVYKFCTNDGWYISPSECRRIIKALEKYQEDAFAPLLHGANMDLLGLDDTKSALIEWIAFNEAAINNKGYIVY